MPWIRRIFLVTDRQTPNFLNQREMTRLNVSIVDHREIFQGYEWALPTFNSISIETVLHRIPGLAQKYIYLNDDFIPLTPSRPTDFFRQNKIVVRGQWETQKRFGPWKILLGAAALKILGPISKKDRSAHLLAQMKAAQLAGFSDRYIHHAHAPHPVRTKTLSEFFANHPGVMEENIKHKFRNLDQFVTHPLAHHLEAARDNCIFSSESDHLTINFSDNKKATSQVHQLRALQIKFLCLQSFELASGDCRNTVISVLDEAIA